MTRPEPVAAIAAFVALVNAVLVAAVALGLNLTDQQMAAISAVVVAIGSALGTFWVRGQVTPVSSPRTNDGRELKPVD